MRASFEYDLDVETGELRRRIHHALEVAKRKASERRAAADTAQAAYAEFLAKIAVPFVRQVVTILRADNHAVTAFTPAGSARVASDRAAEDYVEIALDDTGETPHVVVRTSVQRGRAGVIASTRDVAPGKSIASLTDQDLSDVFVAELITLLVKT